MKSYQEYIVTESSDKFTKRLNEIANYLFKKNKVEGLKAISKLSEDWKKKKLKDNKRFEDLLDGQIQNLYNIGEDENLGLKGSKMVKAIDDIEDAILST